jgi:hypothetical protein
MQGERDLSGIRITLVAICVAAICLSAATTAGAQVVDRYAYPAQYPNASFNGSDAIGAGGFGESRYIAIDQTSGDVYVGNSCCSLYHLNSKGESIPFSAKAPNTAFEAPFYYQAGIAVDNSNTGTQGRLYAKEAGAGLAAYLSTGASVGAPFPLAVPGGSCGVDVAPDGGVWVSNESGGIQRFTPSGVSSNESIPSDPGTCRFAIDAAENFYVGTSPGQPIKKYSRAGALLDAEWNTGGKGSNVTAVDRSSGEVFADVPEAEEGSHVDMFGPDGAYLSSFGRTERSRGYPGLGYTESVAVNEENDTAYVSNYATGMIDMFVRTGPVTIPDVSTDPPVTTVTGATLKGTIDPDVAHSGTAVTECAFEWGSNLLYGNSVPCDQAMPAGAATSVTATVPGLEEGKIYHFRIVASSANKVQAYGKDRSFQVSEVPVMSNEFTSEVFSDGARLNATIVPRGAKTNFHFEYGTAPCSVEACTAASDFLIDEVNGIFPTRKGTEAITGLTPGTVYYWRIVATNLNGTVEGPDQTFSTFPVDEESVDSCDNALVRKQTGSAHTSDCRAYELVSASDTGGYDVESSLVPGQTPLPGYPAATDPPRALYTVHFGAIPGIGDPPNFGSDPYVATRGAHGWTSKYVGLPVSGTPDPDVFSSALLAADRTLDTFAFGGPDICAPCFGDGSSGVPVRLPSGQLVQGMSGSLAVAEPEAAGEVRVPLSADGSHLVFGSTEALEPAGNSGSLSIYERDLLSGVTRVVSTLPDGSTMSGDVAELGVSSDGSRVVIGRPVGTDARGNQLYDLYLHRDGASSSVSIADTAQGALFAGMTEDGSTVYFTTVDPVTGDGDSGSDLYRADVGDTGDAQVTRVSTGGGGTGDSDACAPTTAWNDVNGTPDCDVLAVSGAGGVAGESGSVAFLSPELLDGASNGVAGAPNLYLAGNGGSPRFVATLSVGDDLVAHAADDAAGRHTADFQITPSGGFAVFASSRPITGYPTNGHREIYRYDTAADQLSCASCAVTGARAEQDASLPAGGSALANDGRVFFTTRDPLNLRDLNNRTDVYQSDAEGARLVTTGVSEFDSALLSVSSDGKDVYFFTHDVLVPGDHNGNLVKIYDARGNGGYYVPQSLPPCRASDECHGPGTESPPPPDIGTYKGVGGQQPPATHAPRHCKRKRARRHGRCVKKSAAKRQAKANRGARG